MAPTDPALAVDSPLLASELGDAEALVREAGWNQTADDWRVFLEHGAVRAVRTSGGRVVATAATLPYGGRVAWIGMVLVAKDHRRQGLATRLMRRCIDDVEAARLVPALDATPDGRMVYQGLGFKDAWGFARLARREPREDAAPVNTDVIIRPIVEADWPALRAYDTAVFGAERHALLASLHRRMPGAALVTLRGDRIAGFLLARDGRTATQLGPLTADDDAVALALLGHGLAAVSGAIYIDIADVKTEVLAWLAAAGFTPQRPFTRMLKGRSESFDDLARTYAVLGPEFG